MANFTAGTSFTDGVTNDVTAAKLNALIADAVPTSNLSLNSTTGTISEFSSGTGTAGTVAIGPSGDKNTGLFFPAADTIAFSEGGTESMRIDSSGNVGVGTTSPIRKLSVEGGGIGFQDAGGSASRAISWIDSTTSNSPLQILGNSTTGNCFLSFLTNSFGSAATERLRIDSSGNVGIGVASPSAKIHTSQTNPTRGIVGIFQNQAGSSQTGAQIQITQSGIEDWVIGQPAAENAFAVWSGRNSAATGTERLRIDSSGRVGIGATSPQKELQINATEPTIRLEESGAGSKRLELSVNSAAEAKIFANQSGGTLILGTVATERLRITSGGSVGLRTTSPDTDLHILQSAATSGGGLKIQENSSANKYYRTLYTDSGGIFRFNNGTNEATITLAGSFTNASDARLKKDIVDIKYGLDDVLETKPRSFRRVDVGGEHFGFIAQELALVIPEAVSGNPEVQLGIDYGSLVSIAFRAIQELKAENDSLKNRVAALEAA